MTVQFTIDNKKVSGEPDQTILDVATASGIKIPTLCHFAAVPDWGGCRLCIVEITMEKWDGWSKVVTSCLYPVKKDLIVKTNSKRIVENRKMILNLLMARAPAAKEIKELAREYGLERTDLTCGDSKEKCIMCGLCTRLCAHQGTFAISTINRGPEKAVGTYWKRTPDECIGCLVCSRNCPTGAIPFKETHGKRLIWDREFDLVKCSVCGSFTQLTKEQAKYHAKKAGLTEDYFMKCEICNRKDAGHKFLDLMQDPSSALYSDWGAKPLPHHAMPEPTEAWKSLQESKKR